MYIRDKVVQDIIHNEQIISRVYHLGEIVYEKYVPQPININPDPTRYIPIEYLSNYFNKDFTGGDYWYFSLFYDVYSPLGRKATNLFYWAKNSCIITPDKEVIYTGGDAYNYYNYSDTPNAFVYNEGRDTPPYRFTFNMETMTATLYNEDSSIRWQSPSCPGIETNILTI